MFNSDNECLVQTETKMVGFDRSIASPSTDNVGRNRGELRRWFDEEASTEHSDNDGSDQETEEGKKIPGVYADEINTNSRVHCETFEEGYYQRPGSINSFDGVDRGYVGITQRRPDSASGNSSIVDWNIFSDSRRNSFKSEKMVTPTHSIDLGRSEFTDSGSDDSDIDSFEEEFEDTVQQYARTIHCKHVSGLHRYISTIIVPNGRDGVNNCVQELKLLIERYPPQHWYIISSHVNHIHVAHICPSANGSCRCSWLQRSKSWAQFGKRRLRRITRAAFLEATDYANILRYLSEGSIFVEETGGFSQDVVLSNRYKHLSQRRCRRSGQTGLLDGRRSTDSHDFQCEQPDSGSNESHGEKMYTRDPNVQHGKTSKKRKREVRPEHGPLTISQLLYEYPTCPPSAFYNIKEFFNNSNVNYIFNNCKSAERDLRNWCCQLNWWTLKDFENYYNDPKVHPYFNAYNKIQSDVYYSISQSVDIASKLLEFQFDGQSEYIYEFLMDLLNVIDKRVPKLNTLAIHASPNAGKNYFFDAVAAFFINYGSIGTANKNNMFAFQKAAGKRLVLWNEPNYESNHTEKLKELLAGNTTRVHIKYQGESPPIIILTNDNLPIFGMDAFRSRIKLHRWTSADFLRQYDKKINPLFLLPLFKKYNIDY
ncbi:uncharacterized protein LOC112599135 [Melanaphis sacchari]|uniref:Non-capsid protein NS-1 n=1 Tax=Melanaphis sacchari TaxID=742174 RepID=A0A2H8TJD9_9HEMI|nr:uncharacterized protein LOC112599135 [Melanaphis sacchari]